MDLDFSPVWGGWQELLRGTVVTVEITACALLLGCVLGLAVGIGRLNPQRRWVYALCTAYVAAIRGTPGDAVTGLRPCPAARSPPEEGLVR